MDGSVTPYSGQISKTSRAKSRTEPAFHLRRVPPPGSCSLGHPDGIDYSPPFTGRGAPAWAIPTRVPGLTVTRVHTLLRPEDYELFIAFEMANESIDIREALSLLPLTTTISIAKSLGISHPRDKKTTAFRELAVSFVLTLSDGNRHRYIAVDSIPSFIRSGRYAASFRRDDRIKQSFFDQWDIEYVQVDERALTPQLRRNLTFSRYPLQGTRLLPTWQQMDDFCAAFQRRWIRPRSLSSILEGISIPSTDLAMPLQWFWLAIWHRMLPIDIREPLRQDLPVPRAGIDVVRKVLPWLA